MAFYPKLVKAHQKLDKAVDTAYGTSFETDSDRVAHLFNLYQKMTEGLFAGKLKRKKAGENIGIKIRKFEGLHRSSQAPFYRQLIERKI